MSNKLTPQDYCDMIVEYVNAKHGYFMRSKYKQFTEEDVYNYCLQNTEQLDSNDTTEIDKLVKNVLATLTRAAYLSLCGETYRTESRVDDERDLFVFDDVPEMGKLTLEQVQRLNSIDVSLADDPTAKFCSQEDEDVLSK